MTISQYDNSRGDWKKVYSALSGPTDWILRYMETTFTLMTHPRGMRRKGKEGTDCLEFHKSLGLQTVHNWGSFPCS